MQGLDHGNVHGKVSLILHIILDTTWAKTGCIALRKAENKIHSIYPIER